MLDFAIPIVSYVCARLISVLELARVCPTFETLQPGTEGIRVVGVL